MTPKAAGGSCTTGVGEFILACMSVVGYTYAKCSSHA